MELPKTSDGLTVILVVVDMLTKMSHFIPMKVLPTSKELALIFVQHVVRIHGLSSVMVPDRAPSLFLTSGKGWELSYK